MRLDSHKAVICGFPVSTKSLEDNYRAIIKSINEKRGLWVVTLNLEMIYKASVNEEYNRLLQQTDLFIADGVPLIWASGLKKNTKKIAGRSNGTDLVEKLLSAKINYRLAVVGGTKPSLAIKKYNSALLSSPYIYDGIVDLDDKNLLSKLIKNLKRNKIDLVFLSLGVPKQDDLAQIIRKQIDSITVIGVGGSFDLLSGRKPRAPQWMQKNGLEWFYRLLTEPKRLAKRYLIHYPQALYFLIRDTW